MMISDVKLKDILEAVLMSSTEPVSLDILMTLFEEDQKPSKEKLKQALDVLKQDYDDRAVELKCKANGYCFQTKAAYSSWIARLLAEKPVKYSSALLEVLSIIAYKQPVTRADIEHIRGVAVSSGMLKTLLEREWIRIAGQRDVPGKPAVYVTTPRFLDYFNLANLNELPKSLITNE